VVRAADHRNYYAVRIVLTKPGALPSASVVRHAVINGTPERAVETPLRQSIRMDTLYRVSMDLRGPNYTLVVGGQVVDAWTERRLTKGGIGFFSAKGERARIRWVGVWHQYDTLGRLCAFLAPLGLESPDRSMNQ
jgi:hypothetical protein